MFASKRQQGPLWILMTAAMPFFVLFASVSPLFAEESPTSDSSASLAPLTPSEDGDSTTENPDSSTSQPPSSETPASETSESTPGETGSDTGIPVTGEQIPVPEAMPEAPESETLASPSASPLELTTTASEEPLPSETVTEEIIVPEEVLVEEDYSKDFPLYKNYLKYQKYEQRELYLKYKRYRQLAGMYPWEQSRKSEKKLLKKMKKVAKKYVKKPHKYPHLASQASHYFNYYGLKNEYFSLKPYAGYGDLMRFDRDEYAEYKQYGTEDNRLGYERYSAALASGKVTDRGDADLEAGALGPEITVGIFNYLPKDLKETSMSAEANVEFNVTDREGTVLGTVPANTKVKVKYLGDKKLRVYWSSTGADIAIVTKEVRFIAKDDPNHEAIFDVSRPNSSFDHYRGSIRLRHYDSPVADGDRIWVINALPLEHYAWGMGEITGVGPDEYDNVMTTIFRTYGYWKIKWSTKYADQGFKVDATSGSQIYYGYDWEITHPDIKKGAEATRGKLVMYDFEVALTPYSSWSDGSTRRFEDGHWGRSCKSPTGTASELYPWLDAVSDPRGKHDTKGTCELSAGGNHMVGLSANGAVRMAKYDARTYNDILEHYYSGVDIITAY